MKENLFRITVRFNLNNPEHAEIVSILKNLNKKQIYAAINAAFPGEVKFGYRNFATYY